LATKPKSPRKKSSGTSLEAKGHIPVPPNVTQETGTTVVAPIREVVPDLVSRNQEFRTYYQMSNYHSATRSSLRAVKSSVMGAEFFIEPYGEDEIHMDMAEFLEFNLFAAQSSPWGVTLHRILKFCEYGATFLQPVFENREWAPKRPKANRKTYTMLRKMANRHPRSIKEIQYDDNGGPTIVVQNAVDKEGNSKEVKIPIERLLIFTYDEDNGDLFGKSLLRSAYPHWFYIHHLYKVDAIQKERHGIGVPYVKLAPGYTAQDKQAAHEMVSNLRTNERAGAVFPLDWEVGFLEVHGNPVDVLRSVDHHNGMIMLNVLAAFLMSGASDQASGGRNTAAVGQDIFMKANRSLADIICDTFNLYLVPQIIGYNFDTDEFPRMKVRNLGETRDFQQFAASLASLADKEIITPDIDLEQWARKIYQMPRKLEDRPAVGPSHITEQIRVQENGKGSATGISGVGNVGNASTTRNTGGQGNMGKGNNPD
jgi:hypothetical protein